MSGIPGSSPSPMSMSAPTPSPQSNMVMNNGPTPNVYGSVGHKRLVGVGDSNEVLDKKRLQELVKEVDPNEQLDDEVENMLLQIADDFIEQVSHFHLENIKPAAQCGFKSFYPKLFHLTSNPCYNNFFIET